MKENRYNENENNHSDNRQSRRSGLNADPGTHVLFIGSQSCVRHQGSRRIRLQREGKLSFLCIQDIEWITGDYLTAIEKAAKEITEMFKPERLLLFGGCQLELVSMDFDMLTKGLTETLNIPVEFQRGCHLIDHIDDDDDEED